MTSPSTGTPLPLVVQLVTTLARGGAQATVLASADMTERGIDVMVMAGTDGRDDPDADTYWDDPAIRPVRIEPVPRLTRSVSPLNDLRCLLWLIVALRRLRPAVLHTHSSKAGFIGRVAATVARVPCVHTVHGWGPLYSSRRWVAAGAAAIERQLARRCRALVVVGEADIGTGLANRIGRPGRYRIIRSGVDVDAGAVAAADRDLIRAELGLGDRFVVGMVARLAHPKDQASLVTAFHRADIPRSTLVLVGDGPQRADIAAQVSELGLGDRVRFLGSRPDAGRLVAAFDLAVLVSRWEGMPRAVVEAAAASVPVVANDVGSIGELIRDGISGRLVPVGDVEALAAAIRDADERPAAYRDMAELAQRRADRYSLARMRRDLALLWSETADRWPSSAVPAVPDEPVEAVATVETGPAPTRRRRPILSRR